MGRIFRRAATALLIVVCLIFSASAYAADYESEIRHYTEVIQLNPSDVEAYFNRGYAYYYLNQYERAIQDYDKYIQLNPNDAIAYQLRGICYEALGETAKAQANFAKAKELGYND